MSILSDIAGLEHDGDAYDELPKSIKGVYSRDQWMWLSDQEKATLVTRECEPETFEE